MRWRQIADEIDGEWMADVLELRGPVGEAISRVFGLLGGAVLGASVALAAWATLAPRLRRERPGPPASVGT